MAKSGTVTPSSWVSGGFPEASPIGGNIPQNRQHPGNSAAGGQINFTTPVVDQGHWITQCTFYGAADNLGSSDGWGGTGQRYAFFRAYRGGSSLGDLGIIGNNTSGTVDLVVNFFPGLRAIDFANEIRMYIEGNGVHQYGVFGAYTSFAYMRVTNASVVWVASPMPGWGVKQ